MILQPEEIERESMKIISSLMKNYTGESENLPVIRRVIHATADFDFQDTLFFSPNAIKTARDALRNHAPIITDTQMLSSGISKNYGVKIFCEVSSEETKQEARERNITRAIVNIERAVKKFPTGIFAIGNAPTALIRLCELIKSGEASPALVVGVPVGFVNVLEAKNFLENLTQTPRIISRGRKGGTTVACAIINAILYA